jgi:ACS family D-galactonate transporter-like MFS transporter
VPTFGDGVAPFRTGTHGPDLRRGTAYAKSRLQGPLGRAVFCALGLAINYIDRSAVSVSLPFMIEDFHLTVPVV